MARAFMWLWILGFAYGDGAWSPAAGPAGRPQGAKPWHEFSKRPVRHGPELGSDRHDMVTAGPDGVTLDGGRRLSLPHRLMEANIDSVMEGENTQRHVRDREGVGVCSVNRPGSRNERVEQDAAAQAAWLDAYAELEQWFEEGKDVSMAVASLTWRMRARGDADYLEAYAPWVEQACARVAVTAVPDYDTGFPAVMRSWASGAEELSYLVWNSARDDAIEPGRQAVVDEGPEGQGEEMGMIQLFTVLASATTLVTSAPNDPLRRLPQAPFLLKLRGYLTDMQNMGIGLDYFFVCFRALADRMGEPDYVEKCETALEDLRLVVEGEIDWTSVAEGAHEDLPLLAEWLHEELWDEFVDERECATGWESQEVMDLRDHAGWSWERRALMMEEGPACLRRKRPRDGVVCAAPPSASSSTSRPLRTFGYGVRSFTIDGWDASPRRPCHRWRWRG